MNKNCNWLYMTVDELIDLEIDDKGEIKNESANNDPISNGITESSTQHS